MTGPSDCAAGLVPMATLPIGRPWGMATTGSSSSSSKLAISRSSASMVPDVCSPFEDSGIKLVGAGKTLAVRLDGEAIEVTALPCPGSDCGIGERFEEDLPTAVTARGPLLSPLRSLSRKSLAARKKAGWSLLDW